MTTIPAQSISKELIWEPIKMVHITWSTIIRVSSNNIKLNKMWRTIFYGRSLISRCNLKTLILQPFQDSSEVWTHNNLLNLLLVFTSCQSSTPHDLQQVPTEVEEQKNTSCLCKRHSLSSHKNSEETLAPDRSISSTQVSNKKNLTIIMPSCFMKRCCFLEEQFPGLRSAQS